MKNKKLLHTIVILAGSLLFANAAPKDDVLAAAKKLAEAKGYSWTQTIEGGFGANNSIKGKIDGEGTAVVTRTFGDNETVSVRQGEKAAVRTNEGWQSRSAVESMEGRGAFQAQSAISFQTPAAEAESVLESVAELTLTDGVYSGSLSEEGATELMAFRGRGRGRGNFNITTEDSKGSVKFWVTDGVLTKYEYHVSGVRSFNDNEFEIDRTTTVTISDVGETTVEIPEGASDKID